MALPAKHASFLEAQLRIHEQRIATLRSQEAEIEAEIRIHELMIGLGRDSRILEALGELTDLSAVPSQEDLQSRVQSTAREVSHLKDFEVALDYDEASAEVVVHATYLDARYPFRITWSQSNGFAVSQLEPRGAQHSSQDA
jgi:hypothetical protein